VADVCKFFLTSLLENVVNNGWGIVSGHVLLVKVPVLFGVNIKTHVCMREDATSVIAEPNIVALLS